MLFVFDENFSKRLAEGLDLLEKSNPGRTIEVDVISAESLMGRRELVKDIYNTKNKPLIATNALFS